MSSIGLTLRERTIFGDTVVTAAILDRLMHNAVVFNIKGPRGAYANTTDSRSQPPTPATEAPANPRK
jgi:hypothetical protein